ncbi:MAG: hypothetical protein ACPGSB_04705, partial [Opitutales bacterium]
MSSTDEAIPAVSAAENEQVQDLEVKDAQIIFNSVWTALEEELGEENLRFPKEIFWLNGAPGAGKGTNTDFIMQYRDLTAPPLQYAMFAVLPADYDHAVVAFGVCQFV